ncbi:hypothetical protein TNCV_3556071 [Trichonephila clavipes]|nr:hypothetical protein TNCV_3556071 [Trichonephila clavipes]
MKILTENLVASIESLRSTALKKGNDIRRPLEHMKMCNDFVCQLRPEYVTKILQLFLPVLEERDLDNLWLQDVATTHTRVSMGALRAAFTEFLIYLLEDVNWSTCSPDLSTSDYLF